MHASDPPHPERRPPLLAPGQTYESVSRTIAAAVLQPVSTGWLIGFLLTLGLVGMFTVAVAVLLLTGVGIWGINIPVAWGFAIANFIWWIGIGHAGTLISAILYLMRQEWRTSINRFAEAMTLFAVICAGIFPLLHLGRPWFFYWMLPYPNVMQLWPQFRSALVWDIFAILTYLLVSAIFWYVGLIPDLASMRDRARRPRVRRIYGILALGWRGSARHWHRYKIAYVLLAGLATPLVVSVHSIVSFDFAITILPGWHSTLMPPYFVAGAILSGFAMILTLAIPLRLAYGFEGMITDRHLANCAMVLLATSLFVAYSYTMEVFFAWYSGNLFESALALQRAFGPYAFLYWFAWLGNGLVPQLIWLRSVRQSPLILFLIAIIVNLAMWVERVMIVIVSLSRDFLPSSWGPYVPTAWDWATLIGTLGLFGALFLAFLRVLPAIAMSEMRGLVASSRGQPAEGF